MMPKPKLKRKISHCHFLIAKVSRELANEFYAQMMHDNLLYGAWCKQHPGMGPKALQKAFVERCWGRFIPVARTTLAHLCESKTLDARAKDDILEALALDASLQYGRANPSQVLGSIQGN